MALVAVLILLAVPLYLWRRPSGSENSAAASASVNTVQSIISMTEGAPEKKKDDRLRLGPVQRVKCSASPKLAGQKGALCDALPFFDEALEKAIAATVECAPKTGSSGTINYVLTIDLTNKRASVFPGASGSWKGPQARRAALCVERALPAPDWNNLRHQYRYYMIAIMATYEAPPVEATPMFE